MITNRNGIYNLKLFLPNGGTKNKEIEIDHDYVEVNQTKLGGFAGNPKQFLFYSNGSNIIEYFEHRTQQREQTNLPYILTWDRELDG